MRRDIKPDQLIGEVNKLLDNSKIVIDKLKLQHRDILIKLLEDQINKLNENVQKFQSNQSDEITENLIRKLSSKLKKDLDILGFKPITTPTDSTTVAHTGSTNAVPSGPTVTTAAVPSNTPTAPPPISTTTVPSAELVNKIKDMVAKIDAKLGTSNANESKTLIFLKKELQSISNDLKNGHDPTVEDFIRIKLTEIEKILAKDKDSAVISTGTPTTGKLAIVAPIAPIVFKAEESEVTSVPITTTEFMCNTHPN